MKDEPQHRSHSTRWTADKVDLLLQSRFANGPQLSAVQPAPQPRRGSSAMLAVALAVLTLAAWPLLDPSSESANTASITRWVGEVPESSESLDIAANEVSSEEELPAEDSAVERTAELPVESEAPEATEPATEST